MSFEFSPWIGLLKATTEDGQLLSISDDAAQHDVGAVYHDNVNNKTYVYAYNAVGAALSDNDPYYVVPQSSQETGGAWTVTAIADDTLAKHAYVCIPAALTPIAYYGWMQVQGDVDVNSSDTGVFNDVAWTVGDELYILAGIATILADTTFGSHNGTFAYVNDARDSTATAENSIYLIGREIENAS